MVLINLEHLIIACILLMFLRDMTVELNKKGADNGKKRQERKYVVMGVSRNDRPEVHEESKSKGRVHSDISPVPTDDSD